MSERAARIVTTIYIVILLGVLVADWIYNGIRP